MVDPHHVQLTAAARRAGFRVQEHLSTVAVAVISRGAHAVTVIDGAALPGLSYNASVICDHKQLCKRWLAELSIPTPRGLAFDDGDDPRIARLMDRGGAWVCKPDSGTHGDAVVLGLTRPEEVAAHWRRHRARYDLWLIEEEVGGEDLRLHGIGGRLVAACSRRPASVLGDGARRLHALIEARRVEVRQQNPENALRIDDTTYALLAAQGLTLDDVPAAGQRVRLQRIANIDAGGSAIDVTDAVHPEYARWVARASASLELPVLALDVMTTDHRVAPERGAARCLEINARPQWLHHTFSEGRTHDIAGMLLRALFEDAE